MSIFQRRHYVLIAQVLEKILDDKIRHEMTRRFVDALQYENGLFNAEKFRQAIEGAGK